jgi:hypothetical protein
MGGNRIFTHIDADLLPVFEELRLREPIFHTPGFGATQIDFENAMTPEYWEVGASGRRYNREFILRTLRLTPPVDADTAGWHCSDYGLRRLAPDTYLFTYTLRQGERITRRATIWQSTGDGWHILYHQGTIVTVEGEDVPPVP